MNKILTTLLLGLFLSGCAFVTKIDIEQGNIFTPDMTSRLHHGMSMGQVKEIMGNPVLMNTFADQRTTYIYTFKPGGKLMNEKYVSLTFKAGRLVSIERYPG